NDLFDLGADLATPEGIEGALRIVEPQVARLEQEIDAMNAEIPPLRSFILPGGGRAAALAHLARTVARRAERGISMLGAVEPINMAALRYVNRLSDHLFVLARHLNDKGAADVLWVPGANR
ncbi:MAG: cob(I)yrinic acid a,c-diamide adenosyltransferase, partial [Zavarzinia sp.]|nr:cob(I)yrinic acid a,c-diamide adenosyltransferase [Zavarzinia sp.]